MDKKVEAISIGETMLMFAPPPFQLIRNSDTFVTMLGGAETNFSIGLQRLGMSSGWISKLVDNPLGRKILDTMRGYGVDVSRVVLTKEGRVGLFFVEFGAEPRPLRTFYDRAGAAINTLKPEEIEWEYLGQAKILHQTGITPALSSCCRKLTINAAERARELGVKNSFDVNYRSLLWKPREAKRVLEDVLPNIDVMFSTWDDANLLLDDELSPEEAAVKLKKEYGSEVVVITLGARGSIARSRKTFRGRTFPVKEVNPLGAGDAFDAGFIYGYLRRGVQAGLDYGSAMAALKFTLPVNIPVIEKEDVESLLRGERTWIDR
jgi:2-dehydro-3-deoxygluconokinase